MRRSSGLLAWAVDPGDFTWDLIQVAEAFHTIITFQFDVSIFLLHPNGIHPILLDTATSGPYSIYPCIKLYNSCCFLGTEECKRYPFEMGSLDNSIFLLTTAIWWRLSLLSAKTTSYVPRRYVFVWNHACTVYIPPVILCENPPKKDTVGRHWSAVEGRFSSSTQMIFH